MCQYNLWTECSLIIQVCNVFWWVVTDLSIGSTVFNFHSSTVRWSRSHHDRSEISGTNSHSTAKRHIPEVCTLRKTTVRTVPCRTGGNICRYLVTMSPALRRTAHDTYFHILSYRADKGKFKIVWFQATDAVKMRSSLFCVSAVTYRSYRKTYGPFFKG